MTTDRAVKAQPEVPEELTITRNDLAQALALDEETTRCGLDAAWEAAKYLPPVEVKPLHRAHAAVLFDALKEVQKR